jgi:signal transduction histidine kinase
LKLLSRFSKRPIIAFLVVGIPFIVISYFALFDSVYQRREVEIDRGIVFNQIGKQILTSHLEQVKAILDNVALGLDWGGGEKDSELLRAMAEKSRHIDFLFAADRWGEIISAGIQLPEGGTNISDRQYYYQVIRGESAVSALLNNKMNGEEVFVVAVPYFDRDKKVQGIVAAVTKRSSVAEILNQVPIPTGGRMHVFDQNGNIVYHPFLQVSSAKIKPEMNGVFTKVVEGETGYVKTSSHANGEKKFSFYTPIEGTGWGLVLNLPARTIWQPMLVIFLRNLFVYLVCLASIFIAYQNLRLLKDKELEEERQRFVKLSLVGELAAGVAHEIRNPLTAVKGFLQLVGPDGHLSEEYYRTVQEEIGMMETIITELLFLAGPKEFEPTLVSLNELLEESVAILKGNAYIHNIDVELCLSKDIPRFLADENKLRQVFINMGQNAVEAMRDGGKLTISSVLSDAHQAIIKFKDTGPGVSKKVLERIGSPFVTTKEKGTGLGLLISSRIVQNHGGSLTIDNDPEGGAVVTIILPLAKQ